MDNLINKFQYNAPVTLTFFFVVLMVFIINKATRDKANQKLFSVYASSPLSPLFYIRLLGHVLGHASFSHMINNMMLFLVLAPTMEEKYGAETLLICFVVTAIITGILQCLLFRHSRLCGTSGIVFMLIMLSSVSGAQSGYIPLTLIITGFMYVTQQCYEMATRKDNTAHFIHIIGGLCGALFGLVLNSTL